MPMVPSGARQSARSVFGRREREEHLRVFLSAIWRRRVGIHAPSFGTAHGLNHRRDGTASRPQASTRRPGRSLMSVPLGRTDRGLKDGAGRYLAQAGRSGWRRKSAPWLFGPEPIRDPTQVPPGGWSEGWTYGAAGCSALPASPEAGCSEAKVDACGCWMPGPGLPRRSTGKGPAAFSCRSPCRLRRRQSAPRFAGRGARSL